MYLCFRDINLFSFYDLNIRF